MSRAAATRIAPELSLLHALGIARLHIVVAQREAGGHHGKHARGVKFLGEQIGGDGHPVGHVRVVDGR